MKADPARAVLQRLALLVPLVVAAGAWAGPGSCPALASEQARARYQTLDYSAAIKATQEVESCHDGTVGELVEALRWRAQARAADGDPVGATQDFALIQTLQPSYELDPGLSPKLHALHRDGRALASRKQLVFARTIDGGAVVEVFNPTGRSLAVAFELKAGGKTTQLPTLPAGENRYQAAVPPRAQGELSATLRDGERVVFRSAPVSAALAAPAEPAPTPAPPPVAEAPPTPAAPLAADAPLAPSPASPARLAPTGSSRGASTITAAPPPPGRRVPWAYIGVGAAAAAAVVIGAVVLVAARPQPLTGTLGRMEIQ